MANPPGEPLLDGFVLTNLTLLSLNLPVKGLEISATVYNVFGVLCSRGAIENKTFQITLHGITYSHLYWDFPFQPETYSYVRRATAAGYAVLNLAGLRSRKVFAIGFNKTGTSSLNALFEALETQSEGTVAVDRDGLVVAAR